MNDTAADPSPTVAVRHIPPCESIPEDRVDEPSSRWKTVLACLGSIAWLALATAGLSARAAEPAWPSRPVHGVIPFPPGGGIDVLVRAAGVQPE